MPLPFVAHALLISDAVTKRLKQAHVFVIDIFSSCCHDFGFTCDFMVIITHDVIPSMYMYFRTVLQKSNHNTLGQENR